MKSVSSMHDSSSHSRNSSHSKSSGHNKNAGTRSTRKSKSSGSKKPKLPLSGKKAIQLKKQITKYNNQEDKISQLQEKNRLQLVKFSKKLNSYPESKFDSKSYHKTAKQYDQALKKREQLYLKNKVVYEKFSKVNHEYHSGLSANYHIKARELNNKIIALEQKRDNLKEKHNYIEAEHRMYPSSIERPYDYNEHHFGHSKEYGELSDKIHRYEKNKKQLTFASETERELADFSVLKSTWRALATA